MAQEAGVATAAAILSDMIGAGWSHSSLLKDLSVSPGHLTINQFLEVAECKTDGSYALLEANAKESHISNTSLTSNTTIGIKDRQSTDSDLPRTKSQSVLVPKSSAEELDPSEVKHRASTALATIRGNAVNRKDPLAQAANRKRSLTSAMQARPSDAPLVSLSGHTKRPVHLGEPVSCSKQTARPVSVSIRQGLHRSSTSLTSRAPPCWQAEKNSVKPDSGVGRSRARSFTHSRSTTPELEPPPYFSRVLKDITAIASPQVSHPTKGKEKEKQKDEESAWRKAQQTTPQNLSAREQKANKDLLSAQPMSMEAEQEDSQNELHSATLTVGNGSESWAGLYTGTQPSKESGVTQRDGRRARTAVNYQEPSLAK